MKHAAASGKEAVALQNALGTLVSASSGSLAEIAQKLSEDTTKNLQDTQDVTAAFLSCDPVHAPEMEESPFIVYRGLVQALSARKPKENSFKLWILAGKDGLVLDIILGCDLNATLTTPELVDRWQKMEYKLMGLVLWDEEQRSENHRDLMNQMAKHQEGPLLLIVFGSCCDPFCWRYDGDGCFLSVNLSNKGKNRRKNANYQIIPVDQLGVSIADEAKFLVDQAIIDQMDMAIKTNQESSTQLQGEDLVSFMKVPIPENGFCFWHSVLAGLRVEQYRQVPRHTNVFAVNKRQLAAEADAAKRLMLLLPNAEIRYENGYVGLCDIARIGEALNLAIRCTIPDEAGVVSNSNCIYLLVSDKRLMNYKKNGLRYAPVAIF